MTDKERLNSILRLRLFYSTEKELSDLVGYNLKGNHFSRFKDFQCNAYFSKFAEECLEYTQGELNLALLLQQYETTSRFFKKYIEATGHAVHKRFVPYLLDYLYLGVTADEGAQHSKDIILCERFDAYNQEGEMNVALLLLMTYGLIPTFKNKTSQDIPDIIDDFQKAYGMLLGIAQQHLSKASTKCREMLCLKEMRKLIEEERSGDKFLNRLMLIHITNDVLNRIFAFEMPARLRQYNQEMVSMDFVFPDLFRCEEDPENIVWEFVQIMENVYFLYRNEIDYQSKKIRYTRFQLTFKDVGCKDLCYTFIMRPSFNWHNLLKREQPDDSLSFDYAEITYEDDRHTVRELSFTQESPIGENPLTLTAIKKTEDLEYYRMYLGHKGEAKDFTDEDCQPQYEVRTDTLAVAVSDTAILFKREDGIYRLDKFDEDGNESVAGICSLTHKDNFLYAELEEDGVVRRFICLDSINQNLNIAELLDKPFFHRIGKLEELF